jgi:hypothetical protein
MMIKYEKTPDDISREKSDLKSSPIMRFLRNQEYFKFNIGDVLIKQTRWGSERDWKTDQTGVGSPKKFIYVFENELGIGYVKQLKVDGTGFTSNLVCMANFEIETTRFTLDPEYVDHILLDGDEGFAYNKDYLHKREFRDEAIKRNKLLLVKTGSAKKTIAWFDTLKVGDTFWYGDTFDELVKNKHVVTVVKDEDPSHAPSHFWSSAEIDTNRYPSGHYRTILAIKERSSQSIWFDASHFRWRKACSTEPLPLEDTLCGPQK